MTPDTPAVVTPKLPDNTPEPPVFGTPAGKKPQQKSQTAVYLGPNASPSVANSGYKRLIGQ